MSERMEQAIELLNKTSTQLSAIVDALSEHIAEEDFHKVNLAYTIASKLSVDASQLDGEPKVYEGPCEVNNRTATVTIDGFTIRGNIQFEIFVDDKWVKGHRCNSQYGQMFLTSEGSSVLLSESIKGRVTLPLVMDC